MRALLTGWFRRPNLGPMNTAIKSNLVSVLLSVLLVAVLTGCDRGATPDAGADQTSTIGIINLQVLAGALGRDAELKQEVQAEQQRMIDLRDQLEQTPEEERGGETKSATDITTTGVENREQLLEFEQHAQQKFSRMHAQMMRQIIVEAQPYITEMARARKLLLVLKAGDYIFAAHPTLDITDDVIAEMAGSPSLGFGQSTPLGAPQLPETTTEASSPVQGPPATTSPSPEFTGEDSTGIDLVEDKPETTDSQP